MATTTKKDLIDRIAEETDQKRSTVKKTIQTFLEQVIVELSRGNRLEFRDFGVFEIRDRAPRIAQNPKTLERVTVPAKKTVKFKVGRLMKIALDPEHEIDIEIENGDGGEQREAREQDRRMRISHASDGAQRSEARHGQPQVAAMGAQDRRDDDDGDG